MNYESQIYHRNVMIEMCYWYISGVRVVVVGSDGLVYSLRLVYLLFFLMFVPFHLLLTTCVCTIIMK